MPRSSSTMRMRAGCSVDGVTESPRRNGRVADHERPFRVMSERPFCHPHSGCQACRSGLHPRDGGRLVCGVCLGYQFLLRRQCMLRRRSLMKSSVVWRLFIAGTVLVPAASASLQLLRAAGNSAGISHDIRRPAYRRAGAGQQHRHVCLRCGSAPGAFAYRAVASVFLCSACGATWFVCGQTARRLDGSPLVQVAT
jgi:ribosomal protein L37AE/L43A